MSNDVGIPTDIGTLRKTYFVNSFKNIYYSDIRDFVVNEYIFEVCGKNKNFSQIKDTPYSYLALDIDTSTNKRKIPLWLFSFIKTL